MKEKEIDELAKKIELRNTNLKALESEIRSEEETIERKKTDKEKLEEECAYHESRNRNRLKKLDTIRNILLGNSNSLSDFKINPEDIKEFISETPLQGVSKIKESLLELRNILEGNKEEKKKRDYNYVTIKYLADNFKIIVPDDPLYTFKHLINESCDFFRLKNSATSSSYILKDDYNIWPLNAYVNDFFLNNPKSELILVLQSNPFSKSANKQDTHVIHQRKDDTVTKINKKIGEVLERYENIVDDPHENLRDNQLAKMSMMKAIRENDIIIMIERTFGQRLCYLLFYIFFVVFILVYIVTKNNIPASFELMRVIENEFMKQTFMVNFTLYDYFTQDRYNNFDVFDYTYYQVEISLQEINDIRLLAPYLETVYLPALNFNKYLFNLVEKHKIVGPIRFYQLREAKDPNCTAISLTVSNFSNVEKYYCYGPYSANNINDNFYNFEGLTDDEMIIKKNCENNVTSTSPVCVLINQGKVYRTSDMGYSYTGTYNSYDFTSGYYFDITPSSTISPEDLEIFSKFVSYYWVDLSTRLISISFNAYEASNTDMSLISVNLYLEIDNTQKIIKSFDVVSFSLYINFAYLFNQIDSMGFKISEVFGSISKNFSEYFYLLLLLIYSSWNLKAQLGRIFKEGFMSIFYKNFIQWVFDISISVLILCVVIIRVVYCIIQTQSFLQFKKTGFKTFFCVKYFTENWERSVSLLEMAMVSFITINSLNAFYQEFFERIFLFFKKASTLMFSFLVFYITLNVAYASCFYIMFGEYIQSKINK